MKRGGGGRGVCRLTQHVLFYFYFYCTVLFSKVFHLYYVPHRPFACFTTRPLYSWFDPCPPNPLLPILHVDLLSTLQSTWASWFYFRVRNALGQQRVGIPPFTSTFSRLAHQDSVLHSLFRDPAFHLNGHDCDCRSEDTSRSALDRR